jgi:hypothetical protein
MVISHRGAISWQPPLGVEVTMEARSASHKVLARSTCITGPDTEVTHLFTRVIEPATLAGMATTTSG